MGAYGYLKPSLTTIAGARQSTPREFELNPLAHQFSPLQTAPDEQRDENHQPRHRALGMMTQIYADRAGNAETWAIEGNRAMDFAAVFMAVPSWAWH